VTCPPNYEALVGTLCFAHPTWYFLSTRALALRKTVAVSLVVVSSCTMGIDFEEGKIPSEKFKSVCVENNLFKVKPGS